MSGFCLLTSWLTTSPPSTSSVSGARVKAAAHAQASSPSRQQALYAGGKCWTACAVRRMASIECAA
eukprot:247390-Chlamydomonas_euryale.AAC.8